MVGIDVRRRAVGRAHEGLSWSHRRRKEAVVIGSR